MTTNRDWFNQQKYGKKNIPNLQQNIPTSQQPEPNKRSKITVSQQYNNNNNKVNYTTQQQYIQESQSYIPNNEYQQIEDNIERNISYNKRGVAALIFGILSILGIGCGVTGIIAIIIGSKGKKANENNKLCTIGVILGIIGLLEFPAVCLITFLLI